MDESNTLHIYEYPSSSNNHSQKSLTSNESFNETEILNIFNEIFNPKELSTPDSFNTKKANDNSSSSNPIWDFYNLNVETKSFYCQYCEKTLKSANATFAKKHLKKQHYDVYLKFANKHLNLDTLGKEEEKIVEVLRKQTDLNDYFVMVLSIPSLPLNIFLHPFMRLFLIK